MRKCMEELVYLLKAKMQCIWIDTYEENEVIKDLKEILSAFEGMNLHTWTFTEGLKKIPLSKREKETPADKKVALERIFQIIGEAQDRKNEKGEVIQDESIYVIKDLHLLNETHQVKRIIRDIKERPAKNYNPIIVISPIINIPIEHEKLFTVLHYDTPSKGEITKIVNKVVEGMQKSIEKGIAEGNPKDLIIPEQKEVNHIIDALIGLTFNEIRDVLAKSTAKFKTLNVKAVMEAKIQLVEKSGVLDYKLPNVNFEDVGGNYAFKEWVEEIEASMSDEAIAFGCKRPKGYLALGVPGTAKSFLAEAISNKWGVPLLQLNMSKIMNKLVGESEKRIEQAFRIAKSCAPCVMLWDEVEKALSGTRSSNASDAGTTSRVFSSCLQFLNEDNGVFVIMTSNDVSQLPPELTRSGRLDAMWYFSLPTVDEREDIFRIHLNKTGKEVEENIIKAAAVKSQHYTGAEIKVIVEAAMRKAFKRYKQDGVNALLEEDVLSAVDDVIPIYESSREKIAYLEDWVRGRARYTNGKVDSLGYDSSKDDDLINDILDINSI